MSIELTLPISHQIKIAYVMCGSSFQKCCNASNVERRLELVPEISNVIMGPYSGRIPIVGL